jgi:hypothetical protein
MSEQEKFENTVRILSSVKEMPPPHPMRRAAARRAFLEHAARVQSERARRPWGFVSRSLRLAVGGVAACLLALWMGSGVVRAADVARPGDLLYRVDRGAEDFQLMLVRDPDDKFELCLSIVDERLLESEQLAAEGDEANLAIALEAYGQTLSDHSQTLKGVDADDGAQAALINANLADHEQRLLGLRALVSEKAYTSLDRAIQVSQSARQDEQPRDEPAGPSVPEDGQGTPKQDKTPSTRKNKHQEKDRPGGPPSAN